jgi:hypothetical protein
MTNFSRPRLEVLEDRTAPASCTCTGAIGASGWSDGFTTVNGRTTAFWLNFAP